MYGDVRDTFKLGVKQAPHARNTIHGSATITAVEWSPAQIRNNTSSKGDNGTTSEETNNYNNSNRTTTQYCTDSLVAVAASNGVICVWNAKHTFFSDGSVESSTLQNQQPEAILGQEHTRAVNSLAWHPKRPGILLSASQVRRKKCENDRFVRTLVTGPLTRFSPSFVLIRRTRLSNCGNAWKLPPTTIVTTKEEKTRNLMVVICANDLDSST